MNSIERVLAALTFGKAEYGRPDRVPAFPVPLMQGALVYGCTVHQYYDMPAERIAHAQVELNHLFDGVPDAVAGIPNVIEDVTAFGINLSYHYENSTPAIEGLLIRDYEDIAKLKTPRPEDSAQLCKTRDTISILKSRIGSEKIVLGACIAPFSLPSMLMGTARWMRLLYTPELRARWFRPIIDVCQKFVHEWATLQFQAGAHAVILADGMASATILPRPMFEDLALPVIKDTIKKLPGFVAYESVGRAEPFVDLLSHTGAIALLIGEEDNITNCKRMAQGRVALIGNVNNMKMRRWSPARVELRAKKAISEGMHGYGFILANQGPELPFDVSKDNIAALVNAVVKYGRYETKSARALAYA